MWSMCGLCVDFKWGGVEFGMQNRIVGSSECLLMSDFETGCAVVLLCYIIIVYVLNVSICKTIVCSVVRKCVVRLVLKGFISKS